MSVRDREIERLGAYLDGELTPREMRRVERSLEASAEVRAELEGLRGLRLLVREAVNEAPVAEADLWPQIELRLPAIDAQRAERAQGTRGGFLAGLLRPLVAAAAAAVLVVGLFFGFAGEEPAAYNVVQWLDAQAPVMVLQGEDGTTIIWMLEPTADDISGGNERVAA